MPQSGSGPLLFGQRSRTVGPWLLPHTAPSAARDVAAETRCMQLADSLRICQPAHTAEHFCRALGSLSRYAIRYARKACPAAAGLHRAYPGAGRRLFVCYKASVDGAPAAGVRPAGQAQRLLFCEWPVPVYTRTTARRAW